MTAEGDRQPSMYWCVYDRDIDRGAQLWEFLGYISTRLAPRVNDAYDLAALLYGVPEQRIEVYGPWPEERQQEPADSEGL